MKLLNTVSGVRMYPLDAVPYLFSILAIGTNIYKPKGSLEVFCQIEIILNSF